MGLAETGVYWDAPLNSRISIMLQFCNGPLLASVQQSFMFERGISSAISLRPDDLR